MEATEQGMMATINGTLNLNDNIPVGVAPGAMEAHVQDQGGGQGGEDHAPRARAATWSSEETKLLIALHKHFENDFKTVKRNATVWEALARKMAEHGCSRPVKQCKTRWENLLKLYKLLLLGLMFAGFAQKIKGVSISETNSRVHDELASIVGSRKSTSPVYLMESGLPVLAQGIRLAGAGGSGAGGPENGDDEDDDGSDVEPKFGGMGSGKKRKRRTISKITADNVTQTVRSLIAELQGAEKRWMDWQEKREEERRLEEKEWREQEAERFKREEARAERRDDILIALVKQLVQDR
eukprot:jgi/Chlat1/798/Chrsp104S01260